MWGYTVALIICACIGTVWACQPMMTHQQTDFCLSEFVILIRAGEMLHRDSVQKKYSIDILDVFKGNVSNVENQGKEIVGYGNSFSCGETNLTQDLTYIIYGAYDDNEMRIQPVNGVKRVNSSTIQTESNLMMAYNCTCSINLNAAHVFWIPFMGSRMVTTPSPTTCNAPSAYSCSFRNGACVRRGEACVWEIINRCEEDSKSEEEQMPHSTGLL